MRKTTFVLAILVLLTSTLAVLAQGTVSGPSSALSFDQRVEAQEAIERVLWDKRIWPKDNPGPKPKLEDVMSHEEIVAKVQSALDRASALERRRERTFGDGELNAELDRMARNSADPETLKALVDALHNDPVLLRECLAKPALVDRAEVLAESPDLLSGQAEVVKPETSQPEGTLGSPDSWAAMTSGSVSRKDHAAVWTGVEMIIWGGMANGSPWLNTGGRYTPATDSWSATSTGTNCPTARVPAAAVWTGTQLIVWGNYEIGDITGGRYSPATNSWTPTSTGGGCPSSINAMAGPGVWTGTEMMVWVSDDNRAYRYSPATDSWTATSIVDFWEGDSSVVWTGTEMIVWGGDGCVWDGECFSSNAGVRYNPTTDAWSLVSSSNAPQSRVYHTAVWTGTEMVIFGGMYMFDSNVEMTPLNSGGRYNPSTDTWIATSTAGQCPAPRLSHSAVWTGSQMIVWGGTTEYASNSMLSSGARYSPAADSWVTMPGAGAPSPRQEHSAVWTGTEMIVFGGGTSASPWVTNTGARYTPPCAIAPSLTGTSGLCSGVLVLWSPGSGSFTSYNVYRTLDGGCAGPYTRVAQAVTGTSYLDTTASPGVTYNYFVKGTCDASGFESPASNCASGTRTANASAPTGVLATGSCTGVSVSWNAATGATSYNVVRGTTCGTAATTFSGVTSPYNDTTAVAGTPYQYWVVAYNICGTGTTSGCASGTRTPAPPAPTNVGTTALCTGVTVSWNASAGATSYTLHRGASCGTAVTNFTNVTSPYTDSTAVSGTTYQYWVNASNACGTGPASSCASGADLVAPGAALAPTFTNIGCTTVSVNWTAVSLATQYDVYRVKASTCAGAVKITASPVAGLTYRDTGLSSNSQYSYFIVASNSCGTGPNGTCAQVTTTTAAPAAVTSTTANGTCDGITITWDPSPNATSYTMNRYYSGCSGSKITWTGVTSPLVDGTASINTCYTYTITAVNSCGSSAAGGCTMGCMPGNPGTPVAPSASAVGCGSLTLTWTPTSGATSFDLYRTTGANCSAGVKVTSVPYTTPTYNDSGLSPSTTYSYYLVAKNSCGQGPNGACLNVTTGPACPAAPAITGATGVCGGVTVTWNPSADATSYTVYRGTACGEPLAMFEGVTSPFNDTSAVPGTAYQYEVVAFNGASPSYASACASGTALAPASPTITGLSSNVCPTPFVQLTTEAGMSNYQWTLADVPIARATAYTLIAGDSGSYRVAYTNAGGCLATSNAFILTVINCFPPPEVAPGDAALDAQAWTDKQTQQWPALPGGPTYDLYRGTAADLPALLTGAAGACTRETGSAATATGLAEDPSSVPGRFYWYLVTASNSNGRGTAGTGTSGQRLLNSSGTCP